MLGNGGSGYALSLSVEGSENAWHLDVRFRFDRSASTRLRTFTGCIARIFLVRKVVAVQCDYGRW